MPNTEASIPIVDPTVLHNVLAVTNEAVSVMTFLADLLLARAHRAAGFLTAKNYPCALAVHNTHTQERMQDA